MNYFIERTFIDETTKEKLTFAAVINNNISVILGEPASGKTYQLERYKKLNPEKSIVVELMFIEQEKNVDKGIEIVLLDSIDEALSKNESDKTLKRNLAEYINKCKKINQNVKFVITCRYVEWKEIFEEELKKIDKNLKIFYIEDLSKESINEILKQKSVDECKFWEFIEKNYLTELLKNILMVMHVIDNFENYRGKSLKYFEIYQEIIKEHLIAETDNERKRKLLKLSPEEMFHISSSIAMYMMLNRKRDISLENINRLVSELYKLDNIVIIGDKLEIVFDTALFNGTRQHRRFFHKSVQEYLAAYFINLKKLDIQTIKDIFAYDYGFYEEFEEVIIYLTNIESNFFKYFIEFDPLIFRRHPYLSELEQKSLLVSMLKLLQTDRQRAWGRWEYLENSSLVHFKSIDNIAELVKNSIDTSNVDRELFTYLIGLLEHNYSIEIENIIFEILENIKIKKHLCIEFMKMNYIYNMTYNKRLFEFIVANDLIDRQEDFLYLHIFDVLYRHIAFKELIILIENFSEYEKHFLFKIEAEDILIWFNEIADNYDRNNNRKYSDEQISVLIFFILKHYKIYGDKSILKTIDEFIEKNHIHIEFRVADYDKEVFTLDFNDIKEDFWEYFFTQELDNRRLRSILDLLQFYSITITEIEEISNKYPIEDYKDYYRYFRSRIENIDELLMQNSDFKAYMEDIWKKQKEQEKLWEDKKWERAEKKRNLEQEKIYKDAISFLKTQADILYIYLIARQRFYSDNQKISDKLIEDLGDKYGIFIELVKEEFRNDRLYLNIKEKLLTHSAENLSGLFDCMFSVISNNEVDKLISDEEKYKKLFWHTLSYHHISKDYFKYSSKNHIDTLIELSVEVINYTLEKNNFRKSKIDYQFIQLFKDLEIFNKEKLSSLIDEIKINIFIHLNVLNKDDKDYFVQILSVDTDNYGFIKELLVKDIENYEIYFQYLFTIDINRAFNDFNDLLYPKGSSRLVYSTSAEVLFLKPAYKYNKFDVLDISTNHRTRFKNLMGMLYKQHISKLNDDNLKFILKNYYDFFHEYYHPKGTYSPGIYDNMHDVISNILSKMGEDVNRISLLEELKDSPNIKLQTRVRRQLDIAYNLQLKNRGFDNNHYKNILDACVSSELNNRFFDYKKLKDDLVEISLTLMKSRKIIYNEIEDLINDRFRDALEFKNYIVVDQSRTGESETRKSIGEVDLGIKNKEGTIIETLIEAFILNSDTKSVIDSHYEKLISSYDTSGNKRNFILVYSKVNNFEDLWDKYQKHFLDFVVEDTEKESLKIGYTREGEMQIVHLLINFYSNEVNKTNE